MVLFSNKKNWTSLFQIMPWKNWGIQNCEQNTEVDPQLLSGEM